MSLNSTTARNNYTGNGSTAVYSYGFKIISATDLKVTKRDTNDVETLLVYNSDFTVTGVGSSSGGSITLTAGNLPTDYKLTIRRVRPLTQTTDIRNQGAFYPEIHEDAFDHQVMLAQQQQDELDRAMILPETVTGVSTELPVPEAGKILLWNDGADGITHKSAASLGSIVTVGGGLELISGDIRLAALVDASKYSSISAAVTAIGAAQKTLMIYTAIDASLAVEAVTIPPNISVLPLQGGVISKGSATSLTINAPPVGDPKHQWLSGFAAGEVKLACPVRPEWFATSGAGTEDSHYVVDFNVVDAATQSGGGDDNRSVLLTGGKHYNIATAPWTLTKTMKVTSESGMAFIYNIDGGNHAMVTPAVTAEGTAYSDHLTLENFYIMGPNTGTGIGIYLQDATRWRIYNVISKRHGSHGLYIRGSSWIGDIFGGYFKDNGGDGIKIVAETGGAPNGVNLHGVSCEGNTGWGIRIGDTSISSQSIDTVNIFGGTSETNGLGTLKADNITNLNVYGRHVEENTALSVGEDGNVLNFKWYDSFGTHSGVIGGSTQNFTLDGGRAYTVGNMLTINTRGRVTVKNWGVQGNGGAAYITEKSPFNPNTAGNYSQYNIGIKGPGNLIKNGAFTKRTANTAVNPQSWTNVGVTAGDITYFANNDATHGLSYMTYGKLLQFIGDADEGFTQSFSFRKQPDHMLYASAWVRKVGGTGRFKVTIGASSWSVDFTNTEWNRISILCCIDPASNTSGTIFIGSGETGSTIQFAEVQVVADMDILGWRYHPDESSSGLVLSDGVIIPDTVSGQATIYIDEADGDLKVKYGDGTVKLIVVDT